MRTQRLLLLLLVALATGAAAFIFVRAQEATTPTAITADDYARAEKFMGYNTNSLVLNSGVQAHWLHAKAGGGDQFWYRVETADGAKFYLVDPAGASRTPAFDQDKVAAALSTATGNSYTGSNLPFQAITFSDDGKSITVSVGRGGGAARWTCDRAGNSCTKAAPETPAEAAAAAAGGRGGRGGGRGGNQSLSPDGKTAVLIQNWNLYARDVATGKETQLTTDGVENYGYATDNAGWTHSDRPIVLWSPDSKEIATFQQDQRKDGDMILASTEVGHPKLEEWKYPLPGDKDVTMISRVVIDMPAGPGDKAKVVRFQMPPDQHRSTISDNLAWAPNQDVQWSPDGKTVAFISTSRDHKDEHLRVADAATGAVRDVYEEKVATEYEGTGAGGNYDCFRYLPQSNEFIWFSQRDNWGQLYLYDLKTGALKNAITSGEGDVTQIVYVDEPGRVVYYMATGRTPGRDPYYSNLYRVNFDGSDQKLLTSENADHVITAAPDGKYFLDVYSTPQDPPIAVVRDDNGTVTVPLEKADISKLTAMGWKPPQTIVVKARDGVTDLYGLMYVPTHMEPGRKYPIVNHIYPGPQTGSVGSRAFSAARGDAQALAELGFVVVEIDGMGTPWRGRKFHDAYYGDMGDNTLPDQVTGMKQLAARYPFIDIDRAGIYGHSGGGYATADAMFRYPDFFKVGISESGNHDQRDYEDDWGERYQGLVNGDSYANQDNEDVAKNLKGHLLLAHGTMDDNVPPYNTLLVVNALIKANKDFDLLLLPNKPHGYGDMAAYMQRRRWDYFVRYLMGAEPPHEYTMHSAPEPGGRGGE